MHIHLDEETLRGRHALLCRTIQAVPDPDDPQPSFEPVGRLDELIHKELLALARLGSPDDFADIYLGFGRELARFREFCAYPQLARKTVVAFGGPFSAGKSSLINALIGQKLLVAQVDPTTALPAYVLAGERDSAHALNLHRLRIALSDAEIASLTHDEPQLYGSQVSRALSAVFIARRDFAWSNLAFIDTPGYTGQAAAGDRTDAGIAATQLNSAHAIVWVVSAKQGDLSEKDVRFLAALDPEIPRLVAVGRADAMSENDRAAVVARMQQTLAMRNLPVLGVYPVSARSRFAELLAPLRAQLDAWNATPREQRFAHRFKALFTRYQRGLEREAAAARWFLHRANRIAVLADSEIAADAAELRAAMTERLDALKTVATRLAELRTRFFGELKRTGDLVGIPLPEPQEIELLEPGRSNILEQLIALRQREGSDEPDLRQALTALRVATACQKRDRRLIRRGPTAHRETLGAMCTDATSQHCNWLIRREPTAHRETLGALCTDATSQHCNWLIRRGPTAHRETLGAMCTDATSQHCNWLIRREPTAHRETLGALCTDATSQHCNWLIRRGPTAHRKALEALRHAEQPAHRDRLLRKAPSARGKEQLLAVLRAAI